MNTSPKDSENFEMPRLLLAFAVALAIHILLFFIFAKTEKNNEIKKPLNFKVVYVKSKKNTVKTEVKLPAVIVPPKRKPIEPVQKEPSQIAAILPSPPPPIPEIAPSPEPSQEPSPEASVIEGDDSSGTQEENEEGVSSENGSDDDGGEVLGDSDSGAVGEVVEDSSKPKITAQQLGDNKLFIMPLGKEEETAEKVIEKCNEIAEEEKKQAQVLTFEFNINSISGMPENVEQVKKSGNEELDKTVFSLVSLMSFDLTENIGNKYYLSVIVILKEASQT